MSAIQALIDHFNDKLLKEHPRTADDGYICLKMEDIRTIKSEIQTEEVCTIDYLVSYMVENERTRMMLAFIGNGKPSFKDNKKAMRAGLLKVLAAIGGYYVHSLGGREIVSRYPVTTRRIGLV